MLGIARSWWGTKLDSLANDEPFHIISAAYYIKTGDFRLNPEHPPLSKLWVGLWNQHLDLPEYQPKPNTDQIKAPMRSPNTKWYIYMALLDRCCVMRESLS